MGIRSIRADARRGLHEAMRVPAFYIASPNAAPTVYEEIGVRAHTQWGEMGDVKGTSFAFAEREVTEPRVVFWLEEIEAKGIDLARNAVVALSAWEGYRISHTEPADGLTVSAVCTRITEAELAGYPYPEA